MKIAQIVLVSLHIAFEIKKPGLISTFFCSFQNVYSKILISGDGYRYT
jgi:hypothetical protein